MDWWTLSHGVMDGWVVGLDALTAQLSLSGACPGRGVGSKPQETPGSFV